ncbi:MAG: DegT/DnrJ/EryC1/StrS family aminotransferase [Chloroflexi bacterium]|nr:DegT/DnrJ/EryC1/StrS family aminotransferase [Chloroflexota bacterium]
MVVTAEQLALLGGTPAITLDQTAAARWPIVEAEELAAIQEVAAAGQWSNAPGVQEFEAEFAAYIGTHHALTTNNGTAALHAAFFALGLGPGDEVISPSATYWATAMPILNVGAIPVFADVDLHTMNVNPADVERQITPRTKAIVVMHAGGMPCEMDAFVDLCRRYGLRLVEDASHAHGATYRGRKIGSFGDVAAFSLQTSKLCPAGEGGILITNDEALLRRATALGHYERLGRRPALATGHEEGVEEDEYDRFRHTAFGYKYRISPLNAALGRVALAKLDARNRRRNEGIQYLLDAISEIAGLTPPQIPAYIERVYYGQPRVRYDAAEFGGLPIERFVDALRAEGARVSGGTQLRHRGGLHTQPMFVERVHWAFHHPANAASVAGARYGLGALPVTDNPPRDRISLPNFPRPTKELLDQYVAAFHKVARNAGQLL